MREEVVVGRAVGGDESAVSLVDTEVLGLGRISELAVEAVGVVTRPADFAGAVRGGEGADDELPHLNGAHR